MTQYTQFDRSRLRLRPVAERGSIVDQVASVEDTDASVPVPIAEVARAINAAVSRRRPVVLMMGAHPIKRGLSVYLIEMISRGWITHVATNGAGVVHDWELARIGSTSEDVGKWIQSGQFGLWLELDEINRAINTGANLGQGLGEAVGEATCKRVSQGSIAAMCYRLGVPFTVHVTIGGDVYHSLPMCDGAALGATSYRDFLIFAETIRDLDGGVFLNVGSAVTGPEVWLKALSMARNRGDGRPVEFMSAVMDIVDLPAKWRTTVPAPGDPLSYWRPWKNVLSRTVGRGGRSEYIKGDFLTTIPQLYNAIRQGSET